MGERERKRFSEKPCDVMAQELGQIWFNTKGSQKVMAVPFTKTTNKNKTLPANLKTENKEKHKGQSCLIKGPNNWIL